MLNKIYFTFVVALVLASCSAEKTDWIEVDLEEDIYYSQSEAFRQSTFDIPVKNQSALEFKLAMKEGDVIVYHWTVEMEVSALLMAEFHGHTERQGEEPGTVMFYKKHNRGHEEGGLVAPFEGIHGWYFKNDSYEDIVVKLTVAGFFQETE